MNKNLTYIVLVVIVIVGGFFLLNGYIYNEKQADFPENYKNAEYVIDGKAVKLTDGISEIDIEEGSASKITTRYFGNYVQKDLNNDGREDVVFLLTQETGGSGTFFYVVAALNTEDGYVGSQGLLLGDRIAPQTTQSGSGNIVIVNYTDRAPGEPMTAQPSVGKSIWLLLDIDTMQFGEVVQDFEGEADPERMTLQMKTWDWISVLYSDDNKIEPKETGSFTITFGDDGKFSASTDCNNMGGKYSITDKNISFSEIISTKMYCEGSQENDFAKILEESNSYHFTSKGELIFDLKFDSGSAVFK